MVRRNLYNIHRARPTPAAVPAPVPPVPPVPPAAPARAASPAPSQRSSHSVHSNTSASARSKTSEGSGTASTSGGSSGTCGARPAASPPLPPPLLGRIHCFGDQPLEITGSLKGYRRQGLPEPIFSTAPRPGRRPSPAREGWCGQSPGMAALSALSQWPRWLRWTLLAASAVSLLLVIVGFSLWAGSPGSRSGADVSEEPPAGDWSGAAFDAVNNEGVVHDEDDGETQRPPPSPPGPSQPPSPEGASPTASEPRSSSATPSSTMLASSSTSAPSRANGTEDGEEMVYDTDELVIEGDDGDAEYEGDTEQTLPEFLESILSLWSSSPAPPKVLNGHRYGDTQAGDQWSVASSPAPSPSTRPPIPVVSPTLPPRLSLVHRVTPSPTPEASADADCESPRLPLCRGLLPYDLTLARPSVPQVPALRTPADLQAALPYFELVAQSGCSARVRAFLCPLLEPECVPRGVQPRRPCRRLCRAVAEDCQDFILNNLDLSRVFDCDFYPDGPHGEECLDLSAGGGSCLPREFGCGDGSCIPQRWLCDGRADCARGTDERNCTAVCPDDHFRCASSGATGVSCIRALQRCDGRQDCADGSDEQGCAANTGGAAFGGVSPCPEGELRCQDGHCIGLHMLCDGRPDCEDAADEGHCPAVSARHHRG